MELQDRQALRELLRHRPLRLRAHQALHMAEHVVLHRHMGEVLG